MSLPALRLKGLRCGDTGGLAAAFASRVPLDEVLAYGKALRHSCVSGCAAATSFQMPSTLMLLTIIYASRGLQGKSAKVWTLFGLYAVERMGPNGTGP
jgi:hypothetical protein